jgi:pilus assembly protein Flp/PilA
VNPRNTAAAENMKRSFVKFLTAESGATATEYGLIAAGIALAIIGVVNELGSKLNTKFTSINISLEQSSTPFQGASITQRHKVWPRLSSHSVWQAEVVADGSADEVRPPLLGSVKPDQLPR